MNEKNSVLIIEDEEVLRLGLSGKFNREGFQTYEAENGESGLAMAIQKKPDFIILDMLMPKMDGLAFLSNLKKDDWGKQAKVFVWTNSKSQERVQNAKEFGVLDIWVKSDFTFKEVVDKVKAWGSQQPGGMHA